MAPQGTASKSGGVRTIPVHRKLLYATIVTVLFFGGAELTARLLYDPQTDRGAVGTRKFVTWLSSLARGDKSPLPVYEADPRRLWRLVPDRHFDAVNYHHSKTGEEQAIGITINARGYRGPIVSGADAASAALSVLCMGDSNFFGYPLDDRDAFPAVLERTLQAAEPPGRVRVINGGTPAYSSTQGRIWYEEEFSDQAIDWLLLSFINNDSWGQPRSDKQALAAGPPGAVVRLADTIADRLKLVQAIQSGIAAATAGGEQPPRVSLVDFVANYEFFIAEASRRTAQVLILDFCAYPECAQYSEALAEMGLKNSHVQYFNVKENATQAVESRVHFDKYGDHLDKIRRRWGDQMLLDAPRLWFYAEYHSEHLNELGTQWLADQVAKIILPQVRRDAAPSELP